MTKSLTNLINILEMCILVFCMFPGIYTELVILFFILCVIRLLAKIGNGSFFLELFYVYTSFTCLLMPLLGFQVFNKSNPLAILWVRYMFVNENAYFSFVLPAVIFMGFGLFYFRKNSPDDASIINKLVYRIKEQVVAIPPASILTLMAFTLVAYNIGNFLPESLRQLNTFLYYSLFATIFYIAFYKDFPKKTLILSGIAFFIVFDALRFGMFTIIAYMSGLFSIMLLAGRKVKISSKLLMFVFAIFFIAFLQLFKLELRRSFKKKQDLPVTQLIDKVITNTRVSDFEETLFPLYYRMNQGWNISLVMKRIPDKVDYLGGNNLMLNFFSSFVPRLFWADKPSAGGIENMRLYAGVRIYSFSTNVGPIGEAYGSFGYVGGWIYLMAFAFFIRLAYTEFIKVCRKIPLLFLWMPPIFYQTIYVIEADSLQAFNSLLKGFVFLIIMYKLFPLFFGMSRRMERMQVGN